MKQIRFFDNTRISAFRDCPRKYALRHMLHWEPMGTSPALCFGGAWHEGMAEFLLNKDRSASEATDLAMQAFREEWRVRGMDELDMEQQEKLHPRVPGVAAEMFYNMHQQYAPWLQRITILEVEKPFCVPMFQNRQCPYCGHVHSVGYWEANDYCLKCSKPLTIVYLIGRRDAVYEESGDIWALEHKTSRLYSKAYGFQYGFVNKFNIDSQVDAYHYTTHMTHGERACGVMINGCLVYKTRQDIFKLLPQRRTFEAAFQWYQETQRWIGKLLHTEAKGIEYMDRQVGSCQTPYGFCEFHDICRLHMTPWNDVAQPIGYQVHKWEPFDTDELEKLLREVTDA